MGWVGCGALALTGLSGVASASDRLGTRPSEATADAQAPAEASATIALRSAYPQVRTYSVDGRIRAFYGTPLTEGATPEQAADAFWDAHGGAFGVAGLELEETSVALTGDGRFTVFMYRQLIDGVAVENTLGRLLVNNALGRVVYVAGAFAQPGAAGFPPDFLAADDVQAVVEGEADATGLTDWTTPELVVYAGGVDARNNATGHFDTPVRAWKITGDNHDQSDRRRVTFYVDLATAQVVARQSEIHYENVDGTVTAKGSPGSRADTAANPPAVLPLMDMAVRTATVTAYTGADGSYSLINDGVAALSLTTNMSGGRWVDVNTQLGFELTLTSNITPPGPGDFLLNPTPTESTTAQVNAFIHTTGIHNMIADRTTWTGIDRVIAVNVNLPGSCNAFFDGTATNFYRSGGGCANAAFSSVVAHEYGHFVVSRLGLAQGAFGEGFGDTCGVLLTDDPILGHDFGSGLERNYSPGAPEDPYPCQQSCGGEIHCCGMTLAGLWEDVREQLAITSGGTALDQSRDLFVEWLQITAGGIGTSAAHPQTIIEMLTVDDDNGDLNDGTPHFAQICAAATQHTIPCPILPPVSISFPDGVPPTVAPSTATMLRVRISAGQFQPVAGSATLSYRTTPGVFSSLPLIATATANEYLAPLPAIACGQSLEFFVGVQDSSNATRSLPDSTQRTLAVVAATAPADVLVDDFQTDRGWATTNTATRGRWARTTPQLTVAQPGEDHTPGAGTICWVTTANPGSSANTNDVDGGQTIVTSPVMDFSGASDGVIQFWRWYSNDRGAAPASDVFRIEVTNDGTTWVPAELVGPAGSEIDGGWYLHSFRLGRFVAPSATVRIRFIAEDLGDDSLVEAAVDDFRAVKLTCTTPCRGDLDGNHTIDLIDLATLLSNFGTPSGATAAQGDIDSDGDVDLADLAVLLTAFGGSC